jgi:hypothetical protein
VPASRRPVASLSRGWFFVALGFLAVLGAVLVQVGRRLGSSEQEVICSFLKTTLEASDR